MDISTLTIADIEKIKSLFNGSSCSAADHPYCVGEKVLIRTVTHYTVGRIKAVYRHEIVLDGASWVADTGRFHDALVSGELKEIEPFPNFVIVARGAIVDCTLWPHELPNKQK